jgi:hypothetical protein
MQIQKSNWQAFIFLFLGCVLSANELHAANVDVTTARAERGVNWDDGFWQTFVTLQDQQHEYVYCKFKAIETSRSPRDEPPDVGVAGYRVVYSSPGRLVWQVWVKPSGQIFNRTRRWVDVTFEVHWIDKNATSDERDEAGCGDLPTARPPYEPGPMPTNKPLPEPRQWEKVLYLRKFCTSGDHVDAPGFSNSSCSDARQVATTTAASRDLCKSPNGHNEWPNDAYDGREDWIYTPSCGPTSP